MHVKIDYPIILLRSWPGWSETAADGGQSFIAMDFREVLNFSAQRLLPGPPGPSALQMLVRLVPQMKNGHLQQASA